MIDTVLPKTMLILLVPSLVVYGVATEPALRTLFLVFFLAFLICTIVAMVYIVVQIIRKQEKNCC